MTFEESVILEQLASEKSKKLSTLSQLTPVSYTHLTLPTILLV